MDLDKKQEIATKIYSTCLIDRLKHKLIIYHINLSKLKGKTF